MMCVASSVAFRFDTCKFPHVGVILCAVAWKAAKFTHGLCLRVQMSNEQELSNTITLDSHGKIFMHIVQVMQVASSTNPCKSSLDGHHAC